MYNGTLLIWSPMGQKDLVALTGCPYYRGRCSKIGSMISSETSRLGLIAMPVSPTMKQLSMAATNGVIWLVVCIHKVLAILRSWYGASVLLKIGMVFEGL